VANQVRTHVIPTIYGLFVFPVVSQMKIITLNKKAVAILHKVESLPTFKVY